MKSYIVHLSNAIPKLILCHYVSLTSRKTPKCQKFSCNKNQHMTKWQHFILTLYKLPIRGLALLGTDSEEIHAFGQIFDINVHVIAVPSEGR